MVLVRKVMLDFFLGKFKHGKTWEYPLFTIYSTEQQQNSCSIWQCLFLLFFFSFKDSLSKHEKMRKCHSLQSKKESLKPLGEVMIVDGQLKGLRQKVICNVLTFWESDETEDRLRDMNHLETLNIADLWPHKKDVIDNVTMENFIFRAEYCLRGI